MTNAPSGAGDRYYVYRPMLDLTGKSEGTDKGHGYDETLGYGVSRLEAWPCVISAKNPVRCENTS